MTRDQVVVVGAGIGGLAAAADLARRGAQVTVCDSQATVGGKMGVVHTPAGAVDAGPTVLTMRWVFDAIFADAGERLSDHVELLPADILARHAWAAGGRLDLFAAQARTIDAIGAFAGAAEAAGYRRFAARAAEIHHTLLRPYLTAELPGMIGLARRIGWTHLMKLWRIDPLRPLWSALGDYFHDPRLRQLFGRYATYVGASPWAAPATLMLISDVERAGVWRVRGGVHRLALALADLARRQGAVWRPGARVTQIITERGRVRAVELADGERIVADAVVWNGDVSALADRLRPVPPTPAAARSLSAVTWCMAARVSGFELAHHNVFFGTDYADEFAAIFARRTVTAAPTVYVCAQDRAEPPTRADAPERLLALINAPADGQAVRPAMAAQWGARAWEVMARCGLRIDPVEAAMPIGPAEFAARYPATGGALYGRVGHGARGGFVRPGARGRVEGLYLAGGSVHPGPGMPMAALSGRIAAARLLEDRAGRRNQVVRIDPGA